MHMYIYSCSSPSHQTQLMSSMSSSQWQCSPCCHSCWWGQCWTCSCSLSLPSLADVGSEVGTESQTHLISLWSWTGTRLLSCQQLALHQCQLCSAKWGSQDSRAHTEGMQMLHVTLLQLALLTMVTASYILLVDTNTLWLSFIYSHGVVHINVWNDFIVVYSSHHMSHDSLAQMSYWWGHELLQQWHWWWWIDQDLRKLPLLE